MNRPDQSRNVFFALIAAILVFFAGVMVMNLLGSSRGTNEILRRVSLQQGKNDPRLEVYYDAGVGSRQGVGGWLISMDEEWLIIGTRTIRSVNQMGTHTQTLSVQDPLYQVRLIPRSRIYEIRYEQIQE